MLLRRQFFARPTDNLRYAGERRSCPKASAIPSALLISTT